MLESQLNFYNLRVSLEPEGDFSIPFFTGSLLHGSLGHALKTAFCVMYHRECPRCLLRPSCGYYQLFESESPELSRMGYRYKPHPYVISLPDSQVFSESGRLEFGFTVFGPLKQQVPYLVYAFEWMGRKGLGKDRVPFSLSAIVDGISGQNLISEQGFALNELSDFSLQEYVEKVDGYREGTDYRLILRSPLRLEKKGQYLEKIPPDLFWQSLLRRFRILHTFYGQLDESDLDVEAPSMEPIREKFHDWQRYSSRKGKKHRQGVLSVVIVSTGHHLSNICF